MNILDSTTAAAVAATTNQTAQLAALLAPWAGGNVTARVMSGATLLSTLTHAPWVVNGGANPRSAAVGARVSRTFAATGSPTRVVFRAGSTDIFELTAAVGSGDVSFSAAIQSLRRERIVGVTITATASLPLAAPAPPPPPPAPPPPPPPPAPAPSLTLSYDGSATVGVAEAVTVVAANITAPASVTVARISGPSATISPVPVTPAPGELTKLAYATAAAIGTLRLQASATIGGSAVTSNFLDVNVVAAPAPAPSPATTATLSGGTSSGTTNSSMPVVVTLNGPVPSGGYTATLGRSGVAGSLAASSLVFTFGGATTLSTTNTNTADGASSVTLTGAGLTPNGSPQGYTSASTSARISFWGQSNAQGTAARAGISAAPLTSDPDLQSYDSGALPFSRVMFWNGTAYAQLVPGSNNGTDATLMGPEFGMAVRWMRETSSGVLYMDKNAFGGTSIDSFQPPSALRWNDGISSRASQDAWLLSNSVSIPPNRTFWLWSQAEADSGQNQAWYEPRMQAIVDAIEVNGIMPYRGVLTDIPTGSPRFNAGISAAKQAVANTTGGLLVKQIEPAFPTYFEADNLHLNARGQIQRSYAAYSFFFDAAPLSV